MLEDTPPDGAETLPTFTKAGDLTKFLNRKDVRESISDRDTLLQNAARVADKLKIALIVSQKMTEKKAIQESNTIIEHYLDELREAMGKLAQMKGEEVRDQFLTLSVTAPKEIQDALEEAQKANPERYAQWHDTKDPNLGGSVGDVLEKIIGHFTPPGQIAEDGTFAWEEGEKGSSYLTPNRWQNRPSIDGALVRADYEIFRKIHATPGSKEQAVLDAVYRNMKKLYTMDKSNMTFVNSTPALRPGVRFMFTLFFAGVTIYSLLLAKKDPKQLWKTGIAIGFLLFLIRKPDSELRFLSGPRYEALTKKLQGTEAGKAVFLALGKPENRDALNKFAKRERLRALAPVSQGGIPNSKESKRLLLQDMGIGEGSPAGKILMDDAMPVANILELSQTLQKFSEEELGIAEQFVRRGIDPVKAAAGVPIVGA
ncbi:MAG: hypothetical protein Greene101449_1254 [Candidatus Peregrinibacteria bacterium Greene1014_49]|nr:MAG: hypothetical protein Greene101449_1254 [Candidatus Peregrinibacteria bacterium Greene1014_49]